MNKKNKSYIAILIFMLASAAALSLSCFSPDRNNPNDPASSGYSVSSNVMISAASYINGTVIPVAGHETVIIRYDCTMNISSFSLSGSLIPGRYKITWGSLSYPNDAVYISPVSSVSPMFNSGNASLSVYAVSNTGISVSSVFSFNVMSAVFVHAADGNDSNCGTRASPVKSIQKGIALAYSIYGTPAEVRVAEGLYRSDYNSTGIPVIAMQEGISVYGGYSASDWSLRSISASGSDSLYPSVLEDTSSSGGYSGAPTTAVYASSSITTATVLDGFTIKIGKGGDCGNYYHAGIICEGSPSIKNNYIRGRISGDDPGDYSYGIYIYAASPSISGNTINPGYTYAYAGNESYGIFCDDGSEPVIQNNVINGGGGYCAYGLYLWGDSYKAVIKGNRIDCGAGSAYAAAIILYGKVQPVVENNVFLNALGNGNGWGIFEAAATADPYSVYGNQFSMGILFAGFYCDEAVTAVKDMTTVISTKSESKSLGYWENVKI